MSPAPRAYKVGYARVSSPHQKLDAQFDALQQAGCHKIFSDCVSVAPQLIGQAGNSCGPTYDLGTQW